MNLILIAACLATCHAAKLDRAYLPPESAKTAGGSSEILQTPFRAAKVNTPPGSYVNDFDGVVVDVGTAGSRATTSGLGASRESYGSMHSKVGEAGFRDTSSLNRKEISLPNVAGVRQPVIQGEGPNQKPVLEQERFHAARDRTSNIITYQNDIGLKDFNYAFETDNGISAAEAGIAVNGIRSQGGYSYTGDDGQVYTVSYTADEGGYRPQGAHLPTPPPIPVEILKALEQNAKDEAAGIMDDGSYDAQKYNTEDTKGNTANDYNDRQYNTFEKRPSSNGIIATINQNSESSKPNERYQDVTDTSQNNGQTNQFTKVNYDYNVDKKQINNVFNRNEQNGFDSSSSIVSGSIDNLSNLNTQTLDTATQTSAQVSVDNGNKPLSTPLSQQKLEDKKETQDSLTGRPSSYDAPINGAVQGQQLTNSFVSSYPNQFQNKARPYQQSQFLTPEVNVQLLNSRPQFVSNNAQNIYQKPIPSTVSEIHFGTLGYQPLQQFSVVSPISSAVVFKAENKNAEENQSKIRYTSVAVPLNIDRFRSDGIFLHKQLSLRNQQRLNQQILSTVIKNSANIANDIPSSGENNQQFSTSNNPTIGFTNQYTIANNNLFAPVQQQQPVSTTFSSTSSQSDQVSQEALSSDGLSSDTTIPLPAPSRLLLTPKEDKPADQGSSGITQASISPFPSIVPIASTFNEPIRVFDSSEQEINTTQSETLTQVPTNEFSENPTKDFGNHQNQGEVYEYQKPTQSLSEKPNEATQIQQSGFPLFSQNQNLFANKQKQDTGNQSDAEESITESQSNFGPKLLPSRPQFPTKSCCTYNKPLNNQKQEQSKFESSSNSKRISNTQNIHRGDIKEIQQSFDETGYHY